MNKYIVHHIIEVTNLVERKPRNINKNFLSKLGFILFVLAIWGITCLVTG